MRGLRAGELAQRAGVNVETLRFYERKGILPAPPRRESGYRTYPPETVGLIRFIKRAQGLGLSLAEVKELLALRSNPRAKSARVRQLIDARRIEVERRLCELQELKAVLDDLLVRCDGRGPAGTCPILKYLDLDDRNAGESQASTAI